jgi:iron complex outermembrane receptor protein
MQRTGVYAQDLASLGEKIKLLAGVRYTRQNSDHAYSPRVGLVFQPSKNISLFASYASSFTLNTGIDTLGRQLPPSMLDQYEAGIKTTIFDRFLSTNITVYRIVNANLAQTLAPINARYPTAQELAGEVTSKGLELDIITRDVRGFSAMAGYSFNDTRYTKSNTYIEGSALRYHPRHTANLSVFYSCGEHYLLKGLNAGLTIFYTGDRVAGRSTRLTVINDIYKLMPIPAFTTVDLSLGYTWRKLGFRAKLSNLFNVLSYYVHDDNSVNPIAPRQFSLSVSCRL